MTSLEKHLWQNRFTVEALWHLRFKKFTLCHSGMCQRVCFHRYWNVYLDENKEMWVALHLSARKLQTVFLFPAVMLVAGEALGELRTGKKKKFQLKCCKGG